METLRRRRVFSELFHCFPFFFFLYARESAVSAELVDGAMFRTSLLDSISRFPEIEAARSYESLEPRAKETRIC